MLLGIGLSASASTSAFYFLLSTFYFLHSSPHQHRWAQSHGHAVKKHGVNSAGSQKGGTGKGVADMFFPSFISAAPSRFRMGWGYVWSSASGRIRAVWWLSGSSFIRRLGVWASYCCPLFFKKTKRLPFFFIEFFIEFFLLGLLLLDLHGSSYTGAGAGALDTYASDSGGWVAGWCMRNSV
jgi:hypothetical protein